MDTTAHVWTLSAQRMKMNGTTGCRCAAVRWRFLDEARALDGGGSRLVFTDRNGMPVDVKQFRRLLERYGIDCVPHGFRSSFRDWAAEETDHPREVIEAALARSSRTGRGCLRAVGPVRAAAAADGRVGGDVDGERKVPRVGGGNAHGRSTARPSSLPAGTSESGATLGGVGGSV